MTHTSEAAYLQRSISGVWFTTWMLIYITLWDGFNALRLKRILRFELRSMATIVLLLGVPLQLAYDIGVTAIKYKVGMFVNPLDGSIIGYPAQLWSAEQLHLVSILNYSLAAGLGIQASAYFLLQGFWGYITASVTRSSWMSSWELRTNMIFSLLVLILFPVAQYLTRDDALLREVVPQLAFSVVHFFLAILGVRSHFGFESLLRAAREAKTESGNNVVSKLRYFRDMNVMLTVAFFNTSLSLGTLSVDGLLPHPLISHIPVAMDFLILNLNFWDFVLLVSTVLVFYPRRSTGNAAFGSSYKGSKAVGPNGFLNNSNEPPGAILTIGSGGGRLMGNNSNKQRDNLSFSSTKPQQPPQRIASGRVIPYIAPQTPQPSQQQQQQLRPSQDQQPYQQQQQQQQPTSQLQHSVSLNQSSSQQQPAPPAPPRRSASSLSQTTRQQIINPRTGYRLKDTLQGTLINNTAVVGLDTIMSGEIHVTMDEPNRKNNNNPDRFYNEEDMSIPLQDRMRPQYRQNNTRSPSNEQSRDQPQQQQFGHSRNASKTSLRGQMMIQPRQTELSSSQNQYPDYGESYNTTTTTTTTAAAVVVPAKTGIQPLYPIRKTSKQSLNNYGNNSNNDMYQQQQQQQQQQTLQTPEPQPRLRDHQDRNNNNNNNHQSIDYDYYTNYISVTPTPPTNTSNNNNNNLTLQQHRDRHRLSVSARPDDFEYNNNNDNNNNNNNNKNFYNDKEVVEDYGTPSLSQAKRIHLQHSNSTTKTRGGGGRTNHEFSNTDSGGGKAEFDLQTTDEDDYDDDNLQHLGITNLSVSTYSDNDMRSVLRDSYQLGPSHPTPKRAGPMHF